MDNQEPQMTPSMQSQNSSENTVMGILCYLGILVLVPMLASKDEFIRYHVKQGFVLMLLGLGAFVINLIPILGWIVSSVVTVFCFVCAVMGIINVTSGKKEPLPVIGKSAEGLKV